MQIKPSSIDSLTNWSTESLSININEINYHLKLFPPYYAKPHCQQLTLETNQESRLQFLNQLENCTKKLAMSYQETGKMDLTDLKNLIDQSPKSSLSAAEQAAFLHHQRIVEELQQGAHSSQDTEQFLKWSMKLIHFQIRGHSVFLEEKVNNLCERLTQTDQYHLIKYGENDDKSNNPTYLMQDNETKTPFAILKLPRKDFFSSFGIEIPSIPKLLAPVWEHEMMSGEQDELFGFGHVPTTLAIELEGTEGPKKRGMIQSYLPNTVAANELPYEKDGAQLLKSLSVATVHRIALESLFLGYAAGHGANYVMERSLKNSTLTNCYIIDSKETFIPFNRPTPEFEVKQVNELREKITQKQQELELISSQEKEVYAAKQEEIQKLEKQVEMVYQSLVVMRLWIMGMPQTKVPFDRATLLAFTHPGILLQLEAYYEKAQSYYQISPEAVKSQFARIQAMQAKCQEALDLNINLNPRELFFDIFGGREVYGIAKRKGYTDFDAFTQAVSHPYHPPGYKFGNPEETLKPSIILKRMIKPEELDGYTETELKNLYENSLELERS